MKFLAKVTYFPDQRQKRSIWSTLVFTILYHLSFIWELRIRSIIRAPLASLKRDDWSGTRTHDLPLVTWQLYQLTIRTPDENATAPDYNLFMARLTFHQKFIAVRIRTSSFLSFNHSFLVSSTCFMSIPNLHACRDRLGLARHETMKFLALTE